MIVRQRVGRVLNLFSSHRHWDSPNPSPPGECAPPPFDRGEGHTRWREKGWESSNSDEWTYTVVLFLYKYLVSFGHGAGFFPVVRIGTPPPLSRRRACPPGEAETTEMLDKTGVTGQYSRDNHSSCLCNATWSRQ
jgi:hypothetical protein